ncbi:MAG: PepSY-associated TM helix domain-containing protein [Cyclobacteriaceae bacterium]
MAKTKTNTTWKRIRKFLNDLHLWVGVGTGLILFVVCFTGTAYTFHHEIDEWLNADRYYVDTSGDAHVLPLADLLESAEASEGKPSSITIPHDPSHSYVVNVRKKGERRGSNYLVNPYTAEVIGDTKTGASAFFMVMFRLHRWLMLDTSIGRPIVGWSTVIFVFLCFSGLVIWVPQKAKSWKQGLKIKWSANWKRVNHDLHNTLGFYSAILLIIMGVTGLYWSFDWYRDGLYGMLGVENTRRGPSGPDRNNGDQGEKPRYEATLPLEEYISVAQATLNYAGDLRISIPGVSSPNVSLSKTNVGFFAYSGRDEIQLNKATAEIVTVNRFTDKPVNEQIASSIRSIHTGEILGTFSKILYFISCLIATSLPVTGVLIWINKLKKKAKRDKSVQHLKQPA